MAQWRYPRSGQKLWQKLAQKQPACEARIASNKPAEEAGRKSYGDFEREEFQDYALRFRKMSKISKFGKFGYNHSSFQRHTICIINPFFYILDEC